MATKNPIAAAGRKARVDEALAGPQRAGLWRAPGVLRTPEGDVRKLRALENDELLAELRREGLEDVDQLREALRRNPGLRKLEGLIEAFLRSRVEAKGWEDFFDSQGRLRDPVLTELYRAYTDRLGDKALPAVDWLRRTRGSAATAVLARALGGADPLAALRRSSERIIAAVSIPDLVSTEAWERLVGALRRQNELLDLLTSRLGSVLQDLKADDALAALARKPGLLPSTKALSLDLLKILKGNVAELLALPHQREILASLARKHAKSGKYKSIRLYTGVRLDYLNLDGVRVSGKLFGDNMIIAERASGGFEILHIFEVKSGYDGVTEARKQFFRNMEGREMQRLVVDEGSLVFEGDGVVRAQRRTMDFTTKEITHAHASSKTIYAANDQMHFDLDDGLNIAGTSQPPVALGGSRDEIESFAARLYLTGLFRSFP